jgi:hypothetical protein
VTLSYIASHEHGNVWVIAHRQELIWQLSETLKLFGITHGIVKSQHPFDPTQRVQVASVQTLVRRHHLLPAPALIVFDECHHCTAKGYRTIADSYPGANILGVTATPCRLNGQGLGEVFDHMALGPTTRWLTDNGFLSPAEYYAPPPKADISGLRMRAGDFATDEAEAVMDKPTVTGDAVEHYRRICDGVPMLVFCTSVAHAKHVAEQYSEAGYRAASVDGGMSDEDRKDRIQGLGTGKWQVITSCDLVGEGLDVPIVGAVQFLRPTASLGLFLQQLGRGLRPAPGKTCLAAGTRILTQRGLIKIEEILLTDHVWDGIEWVSHGGSVRIGTKRTIKYGGLEATEDHLVWTKKGWRTFGECATEQIQIAQTGFGRKEIRLRGNMLPRSEVGFGSEPKMADTPTCLRTLLDLLRRKMAFTLQFGWWTHQRVPSVQSASPVPEMDIHPDAGGRTEMQECPQSRIQKLWCAWNPIQVFERVRCRIVGDAEPWTSPKHKDANRQDEQRRTLRAGEHKMGYSKTKHVEHAKNEIRSKIPQIQDEIPRDTLFRLYTKALVFLRSYRSKDNTEVPPVFLQTEREVWDLLDAGPRNCFTAEGVLVHNCCVVLDHVGNVRRHGFATTQHQWSLAGTVRPRKPREVALRTCEQCFLAHDPAPCCPMCGFEYPKREKSLTRIETVNGELVRLEETKEERATAMRDARSMVELIAFAKARGYHRPAFWARKVYGGRSYVKSMPVL